MWDLLKVDWLVAWLAGQMVCRLAELSETQRADEKVDRWAALMVVERVE